MPPPIRFTLTEDEVSIAYSVHGEGPPLVFVRGWISHLDLQWQFPDYRLFMEALGRHFTVIRYDMRGNGLSERAVSRLSLDDLALDLFAVLGATNIDRATFLAQCYGSPILARFASQNPAAIERVVFDGAFARGVDMVTTETKESLLAAVRLLQSQPGMASTMLGYYTNPDTKDRDHDDQRRRFARESITADAATALYELAFSLDVSKDLMNLRAPTLVTHRRASKAVGADQGRAVAALVPEATFVVQEGNETNPWDGDATDVLAAMGEFLNAPLAAGYNPRVAVRPTVVLFSDMVESTDTATRIGDSGAYGVSRTFHSISKDAIDARGGRFIKSTGDGVMAEFSSVSQAIGCAVDMQRAFGDIAVRIGINAGEPVSEDDDLHGIVVSTAARICAQGDTGQILVSNVVRELASGKNFVFEPIGERHLKGIGKVPLYKVTY